MIIKKLIPIILSAVLSVILICGCAVRNPEPTYIASFTDDLGREVKVTSCRRAAALSSGLSEIWLLAGGELYGTSDDTFDREDISLPDGTKSYGGTHSISTENIIADGVDFVILSATASRHANLSQMLESAGICAAYFDVETFDDYLRVLGIMTDITGRKDLYEKNGESVRLRVEEAKKRAATGNSPKILLLRAASSFVKAKNSDCMTGEMLRELGCTNIADTESNLLDNLSLEAIVRADPDFIFVTAMGNYEAGIASYNRILSENPAWQSLDAVKNDRVFFLPKEYFHYKPCDKWDLAYEILEEILYEKS